LAKYSSLEVRRQSDGPLCSAPSVRRRARRMLRQGDRQGPAAILQTAGRSPNYPMSLGPRRV